jgi:hypothetical protein
LVSHLFIKTVRGKYIASRLHDGTLSPLGHHDGYDPKHELRISVEAKSAKEHEQQQHHEIKDDDEDDICEAEDEDEEESDESSDSDGEHDEGCDLMVVDDDEEDGSTRETIIEANMDNNNPNRTKDHREANDVESKQKKTTHVPDKLQVSLKTW